jgi:hypothetical protein
MMSYLVLCRHEWADVRVNDYQLSNIDPGFGEAFLPIFETREEAQRAYPDSEIVAIQRVPVQAVLRGRRTQEA